MATVAYHALFVEIHDDGRMQVRTESARIVRADGKLTKVVDNCMAAPMGTPQEAAAHLGRASDLLAGQLAATPVLEWAPAPRRPD